MGQGDSSLVGSSRLEWGNPLNIPMADQAANLAIANPADWRDVA